MSDLPARKAAPASASISHDSRRTGGWPNNQPCRLITVDLSRLTVAETVAPPELHRLGGRALTAKLCLDRIPQYADPRGPNNILVLAPGLLAGYPISSAGRLSAGGKSPLTEGIKESSAGGVTGGLLARNGVKAIVFEGELTKEPTAAAGATDAAEASAEPLGPFILVVDHEGARLVATPQLKGAGVYPAAASLRQTYGPEAGMVIVGPAGERGYSSACLCGTDQEGNPTRVNGRGGLGAVLGRKGVKAVVVLPPPKDAPGQRGAYLAPADPAAFKAAVAQYVELLRTTPQTAEVYPKYSTPMIMARTNELGCLPTRNFSAGTFEGADKLGGPAIHDLIVARGGEGNPTHACMPGCLIRCSNVYPGPDGRAIVGPLEYETLGLLGSNLGIADPDQVARLNYLCNDLGLDTIEIGGALGVCMEAGVAKFGDAAGAANLIREADLGTVLGRVIAEGVAVTGRVLGVRRAPAVKGQGLPAYDPRGLKGIGVTFATSPQGADHTAGQTIRQPVDHHAAEGQVEASRRAQTMMAWVDALGLCMFASAAIGGRADVISGLLTAATGEPWAPVELDQVAREVFRLEQAFNRREGLTEADDRLPEFFHTESLGPEELRFDVDGTDQTLAVDQRPTR